MNPKFLKPGYLEQLGKDVTKGQNKDGPTEEEEYKDFSESRSPKERQRDAEIVAELRKTVFPGISIEADALASAVARWQKTKDLQTFQSFFERNDDKNVSKEFGSNGFEAMNIIIEKIKELEN